MKLNSLPSHLVGFAGLMVGVIGLVGCRQEPTRWGLDVALPLVDAVWGWNDVLGDTLGTVEAGVLRFSGRVGEVNLEELTVLPDTLVANVLSPAFAGGPFEVPPGAVLLDQQEDIVFQGIEQAFTRMVLEEGRILYSVRSKTDGYVHLRYDFPSVTLGGAPVVLDVVLPPSQGGEGQTTSGEIDLASALIDFTGASGTEVNRIQSNLLIGTPADIDYTAQVYGNDSIIVEMLFTGMRVSEAEGYFGQVEVSVDESVPLFDVERFPSGVVTALPTRAELTLHNLLGADLAGWFSGLAFDGLPVAHPMMGQERVLARADWSVDPPAVDAWTLDLLACTPDVFGVLGALPASVTLAGGIALNPLGNATAGGDYLRASSPPYVSLDLELPLAIGVAGLVVRDTLVVEPRSLPGFEGEVVVRWAHDFPVEWAVSAQFLGTEPGAVFASHMPVGAGELEWRLPVSSEQLRSGGRIPVELQLETDGLVSFSGAETVRVHVAVEGRLEAVIE